jgi:uncharacterized protein
MSEALPVFKYHPDPIATGSIVVENETQCAVCGKARGYVYTGPVYTQLEDDFDNCLCPWCIADGSAAKTLAAEFTDGGTMEDASRAAVEEVTRRTPGFTAWQQEQWLCCCGDAAAFLGPMGAADLRKLPPAIQAVKRHLRDDWDLEGEELQEIFDALTKDDMPTAYVFRCLHCARYLAYVDQT